MNSDEHTREALSKLYTTPWDIETAYFDKKIKELTFENANIRGYTLNQLLKSSEPTSTCVLVIIFISSTHQQQSFCINTSLLHQNLVL